MTSATLLYFIWTHCLCFHHTGHVSFSQMDLLLNCLKTFAHTLPQPVRLSLPDIAELIDSQLSGQGIGYSSPYSPTGLCTSLSSQHIGKCYNCPCHLLDYKLHDDREHVCILTVHPTQCTGHRSLGVLSYSLLIK